MNSWYKIFTLRIFSIIQLQVHLYMSHLMTIIYLMKSNRRASNAIKNIFLTFNVAKNLFILKTFNVLNVIFVHMLIKKYIFNLYKNNIFKFDLFYNCTYLQDLQVFHKIKYYTFTLIRNLKKTSLTNESITSPILKLDAENFTNKKKC